MLTRCIFGQWMVSTHRIAWQISAFMSGNLILEEGGLPNAFWYTPSGVSTPGK